MTPGEHIAEGILYVISAGLWALLALLIGAPLVALWRHAQKAGDKWIRFIEEDDPPR